MSEKKRILVVDDEPDFCSIVQANLEKEGFDVEVAYDGTQGLEKIIMPEKDGYEVCAELKADQRFADIPVLMLTAVASRVSSTRYSHREGMSMEADDYLPKPASAQQILESVKRLLGV
jgi:two-component system alkaline phosphatase synthesis response regulator PhoP